MHGEGRKAESNISQLGDRHIAGKKYCCEKGYSAPQNKSTINDWYFTLLGFTTLRGKPILCVVIVASVTEAYEVETGIDSNAPVISDPNDGEHFEQNTGKGKFFPKGSGCEFNGETVLCLVHWSPLGSITSKILSEYLATLDHYGLFVCSINQKRLFLLLDSRISQFE